MADPKLGISDHYTFCTVLKRWIDPSRLSEPTVSAGLRSLKVHVRNAMTGFLFFSLACSSAGLRFTRQQQRNVLTAGPERRTTMSSKQIEAVSNLYCNWGSAMAANPNMSLDEWRDLIEGWVVLTAEPGGVNYIETDAGGIPAMWAIPKDATEDRVILSIHGGGFVTGSMYTHRKLFAHLAKSIGARALILNFGRSPEHIHPSPVDDVVVAYRWLLHQGIKPNHIAFSGDSAGGGLSVTAQIRARDLGLPLPGATLLMSPWVDMAVEGDSWTANSGKDVLFTRRDSVQGLASMFLGPGGDPRDPLANPLYADLKELAPLYIQVGGDEALLDDSRRLAERAREASVEVRLDVFPGMQHTFQMCAGRAPEADDAIRRFAEWARPRLGLGKGARGGPACGEQGR